MWETERRRTGKEEQAEKNGWRRVNNKKVFEQYGVSKREKHEEVINGKKEIFIGGKRYWKEHSEIRFIVSREGIIVSEKWFVISENRFVV